MTNCPICNRGTDFVSNWCDDCLTEWKTYHSDYFYEEPPPRLIAEWAANRARSFEQKKTKILVEALLNISNAEHTDYGDGPCNNACPRCSADEALEEYEGK